MITAFMGDASNILSFSGKLDLEDSVGYTAEWWVFKPERSGKQVSPIPSLKFKLAETLINVYANMAIKVDILEFVIYISHFSKIWLKHAQIHYNFSLQWLS